MININFQKEKFYSCNSIETLLHIMIAAIKTWIIYIGLIKNTKLGLKKVYYDSTDDIQKFIKSSYEVTEDEN